MRPAAMRVATPLQPPGIPLAVRQTTSRHAPQPPAAPVLRQAVTAPRMMLAEPLAMLVARRARTPAQQVAETPLVERPAATLAAPRAVTLEERPSAATLATLRVRMRAPRLAATQAEPRAMRVTRPAVMRAAPRAATLGIPRAEVPAVERRVVTPRAAPRTALLVARVAGAPRVGCASSGGTSGG